MNSPITVEAGSLIDTFRADLEPLVLDSGKSYDRLKSTFMIAVQQEPKILKCTPDSLRREISKCAADGLVPDAKEAVLLPYWDKEEKSYVAQYQPMVYGIIKRMKELGSVFNIVCEIVCANDVFSFNAADPDSLSHSWDVFSETPRGDTRAAYVIFRDEQKRVMHREIMTLAELQSVREASKAPNSPAWRNFEGEMHQKAVLRRGSKYISINNDKIRALIERQDEMYDFSQPRTAERVDPFTGQTIDIEPSKSAPADPTKEGEQSGDNDKPATTSSEKSQAPTDQEQTKKKELVLPSVPDVHVDRKDVPLTQECVEKILAIALDVSIDPPGRRGVLKAAVLNWKGKLPEHLEPLVRACIEMVDWSIKRDADGLAWTAEHAMFAHKVKSLLDVEKLNLPKYP